MVLKPALSFRQLFFVSLFMPAIFFIGCADKVKTGLEAYKTLGQGLDSSNKAIEHDTENKMKELINQLSDPKTVEAAKIWLPKAQHIATLSDNIIDYIDSLKIEIRGEVSGNSFNEADKNAVMRFFDKKGKAVELYDKLKEFEENVLLTDTKLAAEIGNNFFAIAPYNQSQKFYKMFFDDIPAIAAISLLSKLENDVMRTKSKAISLCSVWSIRDDN